MSAEEVKNLSAPIWCRLQEIGRHFFLLELHPILQWPILLPAAHLYDPDLQVFSSTPLQSTRASCNTATASIPNIILQLFCADPDSVAFLIMDSKAVFGIRLGV